MRGEDLLELDQRQLREVRGGQIGMIFQEPMTSLNPFINVGIQMAEPLIYHTGLSKREALERSADLPGMVGIPDGESRLREYPHQFSGGMRQRVMIAMAMSCEPAVLIADVPTTALDVTIQAQIIYLLQDPQDENQLTYLFIAHDLAVVRHICDRVAVMYLGRVVEMAPKARLFSAPLHPYTHALLQSVPLPNPRQERQRQHTVIEGNISSAINPPSGCRFHPLCPLAFEPCDHVVPEWREVETDHWVACHAVGGEE